MSIELSKKHLNLSPSMTLSIAAKSKEMKALGKDVIGFGVGEPDFNTPKHIIDKAVEAMDKGITGYTAASGTPELKKAICNKLQKDNGLTYSPDQIIVSNGAKHSIYNALQAICNPGDEVLVGIPYWVSYPELVKMADAEPIYIEGKEENDFKMTPESIKGKITSKTKAILLNSPGNPTGTVYTKEELRAIAELMAEHNIIIISDEIYEKLIYGSDPHVSVASFNERIKELTIVVNGLSKGYAMTGWRIGYTASSKEIAKVMGNIQSHATSNPNTIAQYASVEALEGDQSSIEDMRIEFDKRRKFMVQRINEIKGISCIEPQGAFYVMMNIKELKGRTLGGKVVNDSIEIAEVILEKAEVALVPGIAFGSDDYLRLSYANSLENIETGLNRIDDFLTKELS
jgi:aspartate aminotransferase